MISLVTAGTIIIPEIIIRSTVSITTNLISSLSYLKTISHSDTELQDMLTNSDIIEDISIIKHFIEEKQQHTSSNTIRICIEHLNKTLKELEQNISSITAKLESHKQLWFGFARSYNLSEEKRRIPQLTKQLKHRFEILIKISSNL